MAATVLLSWGHTSASVASSGTAWFPVGVARCTTTTVESRHTRTMRHAGTFSRLSVYGPSQNLTGGTVTVTLMKNGSPTALSVSIPNGGAFGEHEDAVNTVSVVPGDTVSYRVVNGGASSGYGVQWFQTLFDAGSSTVSVLTCPSNAAAGASNLTRYQPIAGSGGQFTSNEASVQSVCRWPGTRSNLYTNVAVNSRVNSSTMRSRKNGANGNMSISIPAGTTGVMEDTTNSDTLVAGDSCSTSLTTGAGSETLTIAVTGSMLSTSDGSQPFVWCAPGTVSYSSALGTRAYAHSGGIDGGSTAPAETTPKRDTKLSHLRFYVTANARSLSATSLEMRINNVEQALAVSVPALATGEFTDSVTSPITVTATQEISTVMETGLGTETITYTLIEYRAEPASTAVTVNGVATVALGGLTATATGVRTVNGAASATLGGLTASASGTRTAAGAADVTLGGLTATASGDREVEGDASATLGGISTSASGERIVFGAASVVLGGVTATASGVRTVHGIATAALGGVNAASSGGRLVTGSATVALGGLTATASGGLGYEPQPTHVSGRERSTSVSGRERSMSVGGREPPTTVTP